MESSSFSKSYVHEVDWVRTLAMIGVLIVHATGLTVVTLDPQSTLYGLYDFLNIAFKYGTPTFIFISSFVLFHSYFHQPVNAGLLKRFYSRRLLYMIVPYVLFSLIYTVMKSYFYYGFGGWLDWTIRFLYLLAAGKAHAHLYFVIISIQLYLLFPVFLLLLRRFGWLARHAWWLGFAVQWGFILLNRYWLQVPDKGSWALSYLSLYLLGAYIGIRYARLRSWFQRQSGRPLLALLLIWLSGLAAHFGLIHAQRVYQIAVHSLWYELAWNIHTASTALLLFWLSHHAVQRMPEMLNTATGRIAQASFGIYLIHPLLLIFYEANIQIAHPYAYHLAIALKGLFILVGSYAAIRLCSRLLQGAAPYVLGASVRPMRTRHPFRGTSERTPYLG